MGIGSASLIITLIFFGHVYSKQRPRGSPRKRNLDSGTDSDRLGPSANNSSLPIYQNISNPEKPSRRQPMHSPQPTQFQRRVYWPETPVFRTPESTLDR